MLDPTLAGRVFGSTGDADGPEEESGIATEITRSGAAKILAMLPNPVGEDSGRERILLGNASDQPVELDGWSLRDAAGHQLQLDGNAIQPLAVLMIELEAGELPLNNGGDTVELLDPQGNVMDRVTYTGSQARASEFITFE